MRIRSADSGDEAFIVATAERLRAFGPPPWRTPAEVVDGEVRTLRAYFASPPHHASLVIAEDDRGPAGFAYLEEMQDYFTQEKHGHLGIIAVAERAEGSGAAKALMREAESWARARGYRTLTLNVFDGNRHARDVYEHLGFRAEAVKYVKPIDR